MSSVNTLKNNKNNAGFTLLEVTVVVFIIVLLSTIFIAYYRGGGEQFVLQRSVHALAQDIRRVQELTMRAEDFKGFVSRGGYGIYLESATSSYTLFADCNGNERFDIGGAVPPVSCHESTEGNPFPETLEKRELEKGVKIISALPSSPLTVVFLPPDPTVSINNDPFVASSSIILGIDGLTGAIIVNRAGLIAIE